MLSQSRGEGGKADQEHWGKATLRLADPGDWHKDQKEPRKHKERKRITNKGYLYLCARKSSSSRIRRERGTKHVGVTGRYLTPWVNVKIAIRDN